MNTEQLLTAKDKPSFILDGFRYMLQRVLIERGYSAFSSRGLHDKLVYFLLNNFTFFISLKLGRVDVRFPKTRKSRRPTNNMEIRFPHGKQQNFYSFALD